MLPITRRTRAAMAAVIAAGLLAIPVASASGAGQSEVQRGGALLGSVDKGGQSCSDLANSDFAAIGEYVMQRMVGSARAHETMDRAMTTMMGSSGLESMHRFLGERATRCARGPAPRGIAEMMGVLGMMNGAGRGYGPGMMAARPGRGAGYGPGMMGRRGPGTGYGPGMMGQRASSGGTNNGGWSTAAIVAAVLIGAALLAVGAVAIISWHRRSPSVPTDALRILDRRLANGEIDSEEYRRRRAALGGGAA